MKTTFLILICLLIPVFGAIKPTPHQLSGHWRHDDQTQSCEYIFREDGTFTGNLTRGGKVIVEFAGNWSFDGIMLDYKYTRSSADNVPVGTTDRDKIIEITKDYYVIEARDGSRRKYTKIP